MLQVLTDHSPYTTGANTNDLHWQCADVILVRDGIFHDGFEWSRGNPDWLRRASGADDDPVQGGRVRATLLVQVSKSQLAKAIEAALR